MTVAARWNYAASRELTAEDLRAVLREAVDLAPESESPTVALRAIKLVADIAASAMPEDDEGQDELTPAQRAARRAALERVLEGREEAAVPADGD
jgi:hypothetical protein